MIASTQITNIEIFAFIAVLVFTFLNRKVLFITFSAHGTIYLLRTQSFQKTNISYPQIRNRTCEDQGVRYVSFSENFASLLNG